MLLLTIATFLVKLMQTRKLKPFNSDSSDFYCFNDMNVVLIHRNIKICLKELIRANIVMASGVIPFISRLIY